MVLKQAEGDTADYEGAYESAVDAGGACGTALILTVTVREDLEDLEERVTGPTTPSIPLHIQNNVVAGSKLLRRVL